MNQHEFGGNGCCIDIDSMMMRGKIVDKLMMNAENGRRLIDDGICEIDNDINVGIEDC